MIILSWNCHGLENPWPVQDLHQMVKDKKLKMVFLMETKMSNKRVDFLKRKLGFENLFEVDSVGRNGGLVLLWKNDIQVDIQNYSRRHIIAVVLIANNGEKWKFTGFYNHPDLAKCKEAWALLRFLSQFQPLPWLCLGDFNEILNLTEKKGVMEDFQRTLEDCGLSDLGFRGPKFTWHNGREGRAYTQERLERATANSKWCGKFGMIDVEVLASRSSDHNPLLISFIDGRELLRRIFFFFFFLYGS
jgi:hypothetical protein